MRLSLPVLLMLSACGGASNGNFVADSATASTGESVRVRLFVTTLQGGVKVGAKVTFSATAPAELSTTTAETNAQGVAETRVTMNEAGTAVVTATVDGASYTASIAFQGAGPGPVTPVALKFLNQPATICVEAHAQQQGCVGVPNLVRDASLQPISVAIVGANDAATDSTATVTVVMSGGCPAFDTMSLTTLAAKSGVAVFSGLKPSDVGTGCTLTATSAGLTSAVSGTFDVQ